MVSEMGTARVGVGGEQWRWGGGDGAEVEVAEQGRGWWSWGKGDGAREEAMDVGRGRGQRMGKWTWVSDGVGKRVMEVGREQ